MDFCLTIDIIKKVPEVIKENGISLTGVARESGILQQCHRQNLQLSQCLIKSPSQAVL
jgi:hypothetical protein